MEDLSSSRGRVDLREKQGVDSSCWLLPVLLMLIGLPPLGAEVRCER
jgi:hypothetical protein